MSLDSSKIDINRIFSGDPSGGAALASELSPSSFTVENSEHPRSTVISAEDEGEGEGDHLIDNVHVYDRDFSPETAIPEEFLDDVDVDKGFLDCYFEADTISPVENRINSVSILNLIDGTFGKSDLSDSDAPGFVRGAYTVEDGKKSKPNLQDSKVKGLRIEAPADLQTEMIFHVENRAKISSISDAIDGIFSNRDLGFPVGNEPDKLDDGGNPSNLSISAIDSPGERDQPLDLHDTEVNNSPSLLDDSSGFRDASPSFNEVNEQRTLPSGHDFDSNGGVSSYDHPDTKEKSTSTSCDLGLNGIEGIRKLGKGKGKKGNFNKISRCSKSRRELKGKKKEHPSLADEKVSPTMLNWSAYSSGDYGFSPHGRVEAKKRAVQRGSPTSVDGSDSNIKVEFSTEDRAGGSKKRDRGSGRSPALFKPEDEFQVSDIVWGKVQSHPWWPGQIFDPSSSSEMALSHYKPNSLLIAYFGDKTFAWNEPSQLKPFREWFTQLERKSNMEAFLRAVRCAVEEISRRATIGMSCPCLSKGTYDGLRSQAVVNAGVREESSRVEGGDRFSDPSAFKPAKLIEFLRTSATYAHQRVHRLDLVVFQAQLLAFYGHKNPTPCIPSVRDTENGIEEQTMFDGSGRAHPIGDKNTEEAPLEVSVPEREGHFMKGTVVFEVDPAVDNVENLTSPKVVIPNPTKTGSSPGVGERLCSAISKLSRSDPIFTPRENKRTRANIKESGKAKQRRVAVDDVSMRGKLIQLQSASCDPLGGGWTVTDSTIRFFSEFRDTFGKNTASSPKKLSSDEAIPPPAHPSDMDMRSPECGQDSYWTDRIVQSIPDEYSSPDDKMEDQNPTMEGIDGEPGKEGGDDATALILMFSDPGSVPSEAHLNEIFGRHGPLHDSGTKVTKNSNRAKVVFKRRSDAEAAFSSTGKFGIFGPSLVSYRLRYLPSSLRKPVSRKRTKKDRRESRRNSAQRM